jgi:hypothetical protein
MQELSASLIGNLSAYISPEVLKKNVLQSYLVAFVEYHATTTGHYDH